MDYLTKTLLYSNRGVGILKSRIDADVSAFLTSANATALGDISVSVGNVMTVVIFLYSTASAAAVTTQAVTDILATTATGNGTISSLGVPDPTAHGVCWDTDEPPTIEHSSTDEGIASATGAFTSAMTGLTTGTTYFIRSYATNSAGTTYGNLVTFTTA